MKRLVLHINYQSIVQQVEFLKPSQLFRLCSHPSGTLNKQTMGVIYTRFDSHFNVLVHVNQHFLHNEKGLPCPQIYSSFKCSCYISFPSLDSSDSKHLFILLFTPAGLEATVLVSGRRDNQCVLGGHL